MSPEAFALGLEFLEEEGHSHGGHAGHSETPCPCLPSAPWRAPQPTGPGLYCLSSAVAVSGQREGTSRLGQIGGIVAHSGGTGF